MTKYPTKYDDVIDSRDVIDAIENGECSDHEALVNLAAQGEQYSEDWYDGATLIRDSYFTNYAEQLADDMGAVKQISMDWPMRHIDWQAAAEELKQGYSEVDFDGVGYWVRRKETA